MGKVQTLAEKRAEERKALSDFKFRKDGISHAKPDIKKFVWRNRNIDLRTISDKLAFIIAQDPYNSVLELTKAGEKMLQKGDDAPTGKPGKGDKE